MADANATTQPSTQPTTQPSSTSAADAPPGATQSSLLEFDELALELGFEAAYDQRRVRTGAPTGSNRSYYQTNRNRRFEETIGLRAAGTLLGEDVLDFDLGLDWGLTQERFTEIVPGPDRRDAANGDLLEYDALITLFPRGKLSATMYAKRQDSRVPRAFLPSLDRTYERYGVDVLFNDRTFPMRFSFEHAWDELTSRTRDLHDDEERGQDRFSYEGTWQISDSHALRLEYQYEDRSEQYSGGDTRFDTRRHYLTLNHTLRFGADKRSSLETLARFQEESGDLARDVAEVSSLLRLQHTDALQTNYRFQFLRESFEELTTTTWRGEAGLTHQLDDMLTTTLQGYGMHELADENADLDEWGVLASAAFSKPNDLGRFRANLSYNYSSISSDDGEQHGVIIGESVTFRDPLVSYLAHMDVDMASVVVSDARRTRTYLPGRDYVVVTLGRYTALQRVATGQIADRETVLVTYTYRVFSNYDLVRHRLDWRLQQDFDFGLSPYYAGSIQNEDLDDSAYLHFRARNVNRHRIGATYKQRRWSVGAEYEFNDDAIDPYQAMHLNGDVVILHDARQQLDGKANFSRFWFDGSEGLEPRNTSLLDLGLSYRYLLTRDLEASATAMYRFEDDSLYGDTHGVDFSGAVEWEIGHFSLLFEAEYDLLYLPDSRDDGAAFWIKLKREIPLLARNRR